MAPRAPNRADARRGASFVRCALWLSCLTACLAHAAGPAVRCLRVDDGPPIEASRIVRATPAAMELATGEGLLTVPLAELRRVEVAGPAPAPVAFSFKAWGRAGELYVVRRLEGAGRDGLRLHGAGWTAGPLPLERLARIATSDFLRGADAEERKRFALAGGGQEDLLLVGAPDGTHLLRAVVRTLDADGVEARFDEMVRRLPWSRVRWIAFGGRPAAPAGPHRARLRDGSRVPLGEFRCADGRLESLDGTFRCELAALESLDLHGGRYAYLSDLEPAQVKLTPFFDVAWPPRMDLCVTGEPMKLDGRTFAKGIGMGTRTEMTYRLNGRYDHLYATVGVDDAAGGGGHVVFRVLAGGKELFRAGPLSGADAAVPVSVPLDGAESVTLVSDFGSELRAEGDLADWAEARVVVAPSAPAPGPADAPATGG